ncbi:hypothetical protein BD626DRAFT_115759 [Schizophyllum amplum]|uniref:Uncharacterized protein n=1 Tax=Schizophyllum amplum TaxID=97359 RepID=A0A550CUE2_9AGAR|nr:hypothetical protein BD626DRAFT_115759 [Auriculariopsis ampla]
MGFTFPSASPRPTFGALSLRAPSELRTPVDNLVPSMSSLAEPPKSSTHSTAREEMPSPLHARVSGGGPWTCTGIGTDLDVFTRRSLRGCGARRAGERGRRCSLYARLVRTSTAHTWTRIGRSLYLSVRVVIHFIDLCDTWVVQFGQINARRWKRPCAMRMLPCLGSSRRGVGLRRGGDRWKTANIAIVLDDR